jgi:hypothetical protein
MAKVSGVGHTAHSRSIMKTHAKKKAFQRYCRDQVKKGLINDAEGNWRPASTGKAMDDSMIAGYKLGGGKRK